MVAQNTNEKILSEVIRASWSGDDAFTPGTPQRRALEWMAIEDTSFDASSPPRQSSCKQMAEKVFARMCDPVASARCVEFSNPSKCKYVTRRREEQDQNEWQ